MSNSDHHTPLLEKSHAPQLSFSRQDTVVAMIAQVVLCGLIWAFAGVLITKKIVPLSDNWAFWVHKNPSETNLLLTMLSTALGLFGSYLLNITVKCALTSRLSCGRLNLSTMTAWIQLASNSPIFPNRHQLWWWPFVSALWLVVIHLLTTAWSNLLTPESIVLQFPVNGREPDFLVPAVSNYTFSVLQVPRINSTAQAYTLTLGSLPNMASTVGHFSQAGRSAAMGIIDPRHPTFTDTFNSSTGGVLYAMDNNTKSQLLVSQDNHKGISTRYTLWQQGYTANISCKASSSPTIALNNTSSAEHTVETPSGSFTYNLETWSWGTNCSANAKYYTGEVSILVDIKTDFWGFLFGDQPLWSESSTGRGLFATSVCFFRDFSGPSNQSFLILMQSPPDSGYDNYYSLPTVCEVTPIVTTVEVQYDESGTANVHNVQPQASLPDDCWPLALGEGFVIWAMYFLAQGMYGNSLADDIISLGQSMANDSLPNRNVTPVLEQYLRGMFEYTGTTIRNAIVQNLTSPEHALPHNMTAPLNGAMRVQTVGWMVHPRTHSLALAVITLVTTVTVGFGVFALREPSGNQTLLHNLLQKNETPVFDPTTLMDVLVASSVGSLAGTLSQCDTEKDRDNLKVGIAVTDKGNVLNAS